MEKFLWSNNSRKMAGKPLLRKRDKRKRYYTRNKSNEAFNAWYDWINQ